MLKSSLQMSHKEYEIESDDGTGLNDLVIADENNERRSFKLCNTTLTESEAVHFNQIEIILFLIVVTFSNLCFFNLDCEDSTIWLLLLSCTVGYALPNSKL